MHPDIISIKRSNWIEQLQVYNCGLIKRNQPAVGAGHIIWNLKKQTKKKNPAARVDDSKQQVFDSLLWSSFFHMAN